MDLVQNFTNALKSNYPPFYFYCMRRLSNINLCHSICKAIISLLPKPRKDFLNCDCKILAFVRGISIHCSYRSSGFHLRPSCLEQNAEAHSCTIGGRLTSRLQLHHSMQKRHSIESNGLNCFSESFQRGVRHGCRVRPLLFIIALEPLACLIRTSSFSTISMGQS